MIMNSLILLCLLGLSGYLFYKERLLITKGFRSYFWPHVQGQVKSQRAETYLVRSFLGLGDSALAKMRQTGIVYLYEYQVNGTTYTTENYHFAPPAKIDDVEYSLGHHLDVYHDPKNPADAVIRKGLTPRPLIGLIPLGIAFVVILLWIGI